GELADPTRELVDPVLGTMEAGRREAEQQVRGRLGAEPPARVSQGKEVLLKLVREVPDRQEQAPPEVQVAPREGRVVRVAKVEPRQVRAVAQCHLRRPQTPATTGIVVAVLRGTPGVHLLVSSR
ncbi:MAG: hypothetical protein NZX77_22580, partial [Polyangiaceae bacterium]|nr:hypothetical protein [Polyangiaceae bacterium]